MTEQDLYLLFKAEKGLRARGFGDNQEYVDRTKWEAETIAKMGFSSYYLIVADYVGWAKSQNIPVGPGRGSGAGSLVAYALGITDIDPIKYGLMFERFLNPGRVSMPDFDIDFCMRRREEVIDYVIRKYGFEHVARIGTIGKMKAKLAIRDTARAMGLDPETVDRFGKLIPDAERGGEGEHAVTIARCLTPPTDDDGKFIRTHGESLLRFKKAYDQDKDFNRVVNRALEIENVPKSIGVHAAGVVIWDHPITSVVPLAYTEEGAAATQWADKQIESVGLVKYDFLGLKTLTVIQDALDSIKARTGRDINWEEVDDTDPATYEMLGRGDTFGVFQLSENGMRGFTESFKPHSVEDIATISALFRPGPLDNGMVSAILKIRNGETEPEYPIEALRSILEPTNGVLTYQEQVLAIAQKLSGYTLSEADLLRRAIGKKKQDEMAAQQEKFISGAVKNGYHQSIGKELFSVIEKFADYCFNKSHAIAYSVLSFRTAYLKCHYPADFYAACMTNEDDIKKRRPFITDARKHNIRILPPDVNQSGMVFTAVDNFTIRFGLTAVRNCGDSAVIELCEVRKEGPFKSFIDFCQRVNTTKVKKNNIEALVKAGGFDSLEPSMNRFELFEYVPLVMDATKNDQQAAKAGQTNMFDQLFENREASVVIQKPRVPFNQMQFLADEKEMLGLYISGSPLDAYAEIKEAINIDEVASLEVPDLYVTLLVMISDIVIKQGRNGQFAFLKLEDETGIIAGKMWSNVFNKYSRELVEGACVVVRGKTNEYRGIEVLVDSIIPAQQELSRTSKPVILDQLSVTSAQRISNLGRGKVPIDLEIGPYRYRLGHFDVPSNFLANLER